MMSQWHSIICAKFFKVFLPELQDDGKSGYGIAQMNSNGFCATCAANTSYNQTKVSSLISLFF